MTSWTFHTLASKPRFVGCVFAILSSLVMGTTAQAVDFFTASFSEKELKLQHPTDSSWDSWLMGDIGYQRMIERNSPFIELVNDINSTSNITEFHLTIGDNRFNFAPVDGTSPVKLGRTTPGYTITGSTTDSGDALVVNIGGTGLKPGDAVKFKIKLGIDASFATEYANKFGSSVPDYRTVLFDMNGFNVYDNAPHKSDEDNAQAYAVFNSGDKSDTVVFPDQEVAVSQYYNNRLRSGCCCVDDPVQIFQLEAGTTPPVPEPGSLVLVVLSIGSLLSFRSRSPRVAA